MSHEVEPLSAEASDAGLVAIIRSLAAAPGATVPLSAIRAELAGLSDDEVVVALIDAERRGAIVLESSGESPGRDVTWWIKRGARGALCWARAKVDA